MVNTKQMEIALILVTALLFGSTFICGFWLAFSGEIITDADVMFHMGLAVLTAVFSLGTIGKLLQKQS
ncbi:MAG: hypothetical protein ACW98F_16395 [Candidatus Hodarchaeales archaeon]|jgi:hypothetical protein